jgi:hypothetical protein
VFRRLRESSSYTPKAVIYGNSDWREEGLEERLVEKDPYESAALVLSELKEIKPPKVSDIHLNALIALTASGTLSCGVLNYV